MLKNKVLNYYYNKLYSNNILINLIRLITKVKAYLKIKKLY